MSQQLVLNTLSIAKDLEVAGFPRTQAETQANIFQQQMEAQLRAQTTQEEKYFRELVTKADLQEARYELLKWMAMGFLANAAFIIGILGFIK